MATHQFTRSTPLVCSGSLQTLKTCTTNRWFGTVRLVNQTTSSRVISVFQDVGGVNFELLNAWTLNAGDVYVLDKLVLLEGDLIEVQIPSGTTDNVVAFCCGLNVTD